MEAEQDESGTELALDLERAAELHKLRLDVVTREVVEALRGGGVPSILLKGPAIDRWLYDRGRSYQDIDLLVPSDRIETADAIVASLGFSGGAAPASDFDFPIHDAEWFRRLDGVRLELATTLPGVRVGNQRAWEVLSAGAESMPLGVDDYHVAVLAPPARALLVALHAASHGPTLPHASVDLERALEQLPSEVWEEALDLARELDAVPAFTTGLRFFPQGSGFADAHGLTTTSVEAELRAAGDPGMAMMLDWLTRLPGPRAKLVFLLRELFPPRSVMKRRYEGAGRGSMGLLAAYALRLIALLREFPAAVVAWRRAARRAR